MKLWWARGVDERGGGFDFIGGEVLKLSRISLRRGFAALAAEQEECGGEEEGEGSRFGRGFNDAVEFEAAAEAGVREVIPGAGGGRVGREDEGVVLLLASVLIWDATGRGWCRWGGGRLRGSRGGREE
jgi:hypothetical protein